MRTKSMYEMSLEEQRSLNWHLAVPRATSPMMSRRIQELEAPEAQPLRAD